MRKKTSWLFLLTVFLSLFSCRNDLLPEQEAYSNSSKFQLTSKRISLNESKHKVKLLPELEKAKHGFEAKNIAGKVVHYGNGVSINTDDVIYIENGPNYYTYTFKIERENAPADAPVENLVVSPLSDGTWREMLITYNLTEQEKQTMNAGGTVDLAGKVNYTPLESGTYSSAMKQDMICYYKTSSYYTSCSDNAHHHGEASDENGGPCLAETQSVLVITVTRVCEMVGGGGTGEGVPPGVTNPQGGGTGGGTTEPGGSNGSANTSQPCDGNGIISQPQNPGTTLESQTGCNTGTPTLPNLGGNPQTQTPCEKIKSIFADTKFKEKFNELKKPENFDLDHEKAFIMRYPPIGNNIPPSYFSVDMPPCSTNNEDAVMPSNAAGLVGLMHTHTNLDCHGNYPVKAPSPVDIKYLLNTLLSQANQYTGSYSNAYSITITSGGSYMLVYTGTTYPGSLNYNTVLQLKEDYTKAFQDLYSYKDNITQSDIEKLFTKFMKEKINKPGLEVYRVTSTSAVKLEYDPNSPNSVKQTPCP
ncbi:hypothetical protein [Chryseobacterium profundimaris]|nr:hypothetical protein [Chryseobacterium profundimaris]